MYILGMYLLYLYIKYLILSLYQILEKFISVTVRISNGQ